MELAHHIWPQGRSHVSPLAAPKLVFLHGMGGTGALWRPIAAGLEEDFDILAVDQRGHGRSQTPSVPGGRNSASYTPLDYGQDVVETLALLNFHPAFVIGHSMGVRTSCALAHLKPEWVQGMVLIDLGFSGVAGGGLGEGLAAFLKKLPVSFASRAEAREFMKQECPDPSIAQYLMAVATGALGGGITFPFDHAALIETIYAARDASVREWIKEAGQRKIPVLVLRGAQSGVWSQAEYETEKKGLASYSSIQFEEFEGAGHGLPFEKRIEFIARLRRFIRENSPE